ncbi:hypothetical protein CEK25_013040 [Fusarium fujikuroi]|nr:hypothetical protein CEK25_013040 [Fusarium fujikuroi]
MRAQCRKYRETSYKKVSKAKQTKLSGTAQSILRSPLASAKKPSGSPQTQWKTLTVANKEAIASGTKKADEEDSHRGRQRRYRSAINDLWRTASPSISSTCWPKYLEENTDGELLRHWELSNEALLKLGK